MDDSDMESDSVVSKSLETKKRPEKPNFYMAEPQIRDLYTAFTLFDTNSNGWIDLADIRVSFRALGFEPSRAELNKYGRMANFNSTNRIAFNDYVEIMTHKMTERDSLENLIKTFRIMDEMGTGSIDKHTLKNISEQLGEELSDETLEEMIKSANNNGGDKVTLDEFLKFVTQYTLCQENY